MYDKANSILQIRGAKSSTDELLRRITAVCESLPPSGTDYRTAIVRRACSDLLSPSAGPNPPLFTLRPHVAAEMARIADRDLQRYLFYRYRYDVFPQTQELDSYPPCIQIEPTSICNYRCVFCYQTDPVLTSPKNGHMGMMSFDLFRRIVDQIEGHCEAVTLASRGEPLMCRNIEQMIRYLGGKFLGAKLNTNAWFLDERKSHAILESGIGTLVISADAAAEPAYSSFRVNGKLERIVENVRRFRDIRAKHYPDSAIITRVSGVRYAKTQDLDAMEAFWGELVDQVVFVHYIPWENVYEQSATFLTAPCSDLWRRIFVWNNGVINPCDVDYRSTLAAGTAEHDSLSTVWTGDRYQEYRRQHLVGKRGGMSPCNRCTVV